MTRTSPRSGFAKVLSGLCLSIGLLLGACTVPDSNINLTRDMNMNTGPGLPDLSGLDLAIPSGSIGAPCAKTADCTTGKAPVCWVNNILEDPGNLRTPGGYCSSACTDDNDCGGQGLCQAITGTVKYCVAKCAFAGYCRALEGYGCFILGKSAGYCYPASSLLCNPTQIDPGTNNGTCPGADPPSGCLRRTFEDRGECRALCQAGASTCASQNGVQQHCVYIDSTKDGSGLQTRDTFKGLICLPLSKAPKSDGATCQYFDECGDGYQCNLTKGGDSKCRPLCIVGVQGACNAPATCKDVFGAGTGKPGLCT